VSKDTCPAGTTTVVFLKKYLSQPVCVAGLTEEPPDQSDWKKVSLSL